MNAKERFYSGLAKETIGKITSNTDNWTSFLRTMSRNYEFTYPEQVMIYAQRPNATFCKPYEDWNAENYRRYVKRGSTGIALFVMNRDFLAFSRWNSAVSSSLSCGNTAARNHLHNRE